MFTVGSQSVTKQEKLSLMSQSLMSKAYYKKTTRKLMGNKLNVALPASAQGDFKFMQDYFVIFKISDC